MRQIANREAEDQGRDDSGGPVLRPLEKDDDAVTLAEHGVTTQQMSRWRKLTEIPEDRFEA